LRATHPRAPAPPVSPGICITPAARPAPQRHYRATHCGTHLALLPGPAGWDSCNPTLATVIVSLAYGLTDVLRVRGRLRK